MVGEGLCTLQKEHNTSEYDVFFCPDTKIHNKMAPLCKGSCRAYARLRDCLNKTMLKMNTFWGGRRDPPLQIPLMAHTKYNLIFCDVCVTTLPSKLKILPPYLSSWEGFLLCGKGVDFRSFHLLVMAVFCTA